MPARRPRREPTAARQSGLAPLADQSFLAYARPTPKPFMRFVSGHFPSGTISQPHDHPCIALHGCLQGPLTLITERERLELDSGVFYLLAPGTRHHWHNACPHTAATMAVLIDAEAPGTWPAAAGVKECCQQLAQLVTGCHRFNIARDSELYHAFWLAADHLTAEHPREPTATCGALLTLLGLATARLAENQTPAAGSPANVARQMRLFLLARVNDRLSIAEVAREVGVSPTKAKEAFRKAFGCGIIAYHNQLKIWQAKRLLADPTLTVEQVSRRLGFGTPSYFAQVFCEHAGETPTAYRSRGE